ncbi:MAG TPA: DUF1559 domain-containing protein [Pirellulales bacterium]|jgi:prepilin-type N-terminal cleavage/methylation domain-containing protein/prepilin-type processing-associated H-X9-DG protein|nr:DUF1559 domain-containing protein [Pirellulales bacterium]
MPRSPRGFTLVELLVVITIIGILMSLLFPAINSIKESARQAVCKQNLTQIAKGCGNHRAAQGFFPTGGWGLQWAGDPDRGYTFRQPGGWIYNLLPYIGEEELHNVGKGQPDATKRSAIAPALARYLPLFQCPSRGRPQTVNYTSSKPYNNIIAPTQVSVSDFAANAGDLLPGTGAVPTSLADGDKMNEQQWSLCASSKQNPAGLNAGGSSTQSNMLPTGVMFLRSQIKTVPDGDVCTYLVGEKFCQPVDYSASTAQGWDIGYDPGIYRWAGLDASGVMQPPYQDSPNQNYPNSFGSFHTNGVNMVFCDSHVQTVSFYIDPEVHRQLANRNDGTATDVTKAD